MSREVGWKLVAWGLSEDVPRSLWGVWVYIYIYIYVCVCMYVCMYVYIHMYVYVYVYIYIYERERAAFRVYLTHTVDYYKYVELKYLQ